MAVHSEMRDQILREGDLEGHLDMAVTADRARVTAHLNVAMERLHGLLTQAFEDYQLTSANVTVAPGASDWTISASLFKLRDVEFVPAGAPTRPQQLDTFAWVERNRTGGVRRYALAGDKVLIRPVELGPGDYVYWYTPRFTRFLPETPGTVYDAINGWEIVAILEAAIALKDASEKDTSVLRTRLAGYYAQIEAERLRRLTGRPKRVRKVRRTYFDRLRMDRWWENEP